jgi:hypothetical protein
VSEVFYALGISFFGAACAVKIMGNSGAAWFVFGVGAVCMLCGDISRNRTKR